MDDDGGDMEVLGSSRSFNMASHLMNEEVGTSRRQSFSRNKLEPVQEVGINMKRKTIMIHISACYSRRVQRCDDSPHAGDF